MSKLTWACSWGVLMHMAAHAGRVEPTDRLQLRLDARLPALRAPASPQWPADPVQSKPVAQAHQDPTRSEQGHIQRLALDASLDQTNRMGYSRDLALTLAPGDGIDADGWRLRVAYNQGAYRYVADPDRLSIVRGQSRQQEVLLGRAWLGSRAAVTVFTGYAWSQAREPGSVVRDSGSKSSLTMFARPVDGWRAFSSLSYTHMSRYTQWYTKVGTTNSVGAFWGPEVKAEWRGGDPWRRPLAAWRLGAHVSSLPLGGAWLSLSVGRVHDQALGFGAYAGLGLYGAF